MNSPAGGEIRYRLADQQDETLLSQIHHIAAFAHSGVSPEDIPPLEYALCDPQFNVYFRDWGRSGDTGVIAGDVTTQATVGAAWYRTYSREEHQRILSRGVDIPPHEISIGVVPSYQRRGIGSTLLKYLMGQAEHDGIKTLGLGVSVNNPDARRLYAHIGFTFLALIPGCEIMTAQL